MVKMFIILLAICFILTPISVAYADVIYGGPGVVEFALLAAMVIGVIAGTMSLIRAFWKRVKGKKGNS